MKRFGNYLYRWLPFATCYGLIFYMSSRQVSQLPSGIPDVIPHFIEFFVLAFLYMRGLKVRTTRILLKGMLFLAALAILDEIHQLYVPTRVFSLLDILYDLSGIAAGLLCYIRMQPRLPVFLR